MSELWTPAATDEAQISRMLRDYDDELRLVPQPGEQGLVWQVRRYQGNDRPSELVCVWQSEHGDPYPLSSGILDLVKQLDKNTRSARLDADARNALKQAEEAKQWDRDVEAITGDWLMPHGRPVLPRSQSLRMARDKRRSRGEKI